jgi:hypothetical protein
MVLIVCSLLLTSLCGSPDEKGDGTVPSLKSYKSVLSGRKILRIR